MAVVPPQTRAALTPWQHPAPGRWQVWADRFDATPLGGMRVTGLSFTQVLSGFGKGSAVVSVSESPLERTDLLRLWSWRMWVFYEGTPVWCGLPSSIRDDAGATVEIEFTEVHGYLQRRAMDLEGLHNATSVEANLRCRYTQVEQVYIATDVARPVSDIGMELVPEVGTGFLRDRSYTYLEGPYRSDLLTNLSNVIEGPEFRAEYAMVAGRPVPRLRIAYPRVGSPDSELGLRVPGNAIGPSLAWDGQKMRTRTFALGDVPSEEPTTRDELEQRPRLVFVVDRPQAPMVPRLDYIDDWPGVVLVATLEERANTNASLYAGPTLTVSGSVHETDPHLLSYGLGDDVTVLVFDRMHEDGVTAVGRLVERGVDPATGTIDWTVNLTGQPRIPGTRALGDEALPPVYGRRPITAQINDVAGDVATMFRRWGGRG